MADVFLRCVNVSISASWLVLAVVVLRLILKKAPKWIFCIMWALVAIRLVCPFNIESKLSLIPSGATVPEEMFVMGPPENRQNAVLNMEINPAIPGNCSPEIDTTVERMQVNEMYATFIWIAGIIGLLVYTLMSYLRLRSRVKTAVLMADNIYQSEKVASPFVLGLVRPKIYLPFKIADGEMEYVIAHEKAHIKRGDHWIKPLGFLILALYWFNPVIWAAYILLCRDIELACDERVIKNLGNEQRADYSQSLLCCSVPRRTIAACPIAFGEVGVKERVKNVLNYKKPGFLIIVVAATASAVLAVCFLTNPKNAPVNLEKIEYNLNTSQLDELRYRLRNVDIVKTDKYSEKLNPLYSITIKAQGTEQFVFYVFDEDGKNVRFEYQGEYYRIDDDEFNDYLSQICSGDSRSSADGGGENLKKLTLYDVIELSEKGNDLKWSDFDEYSYFETGSGLYIRIYEIDEMFSLWIGGGAGDAASGEKGYPAINPLYFYLQANDESQMQIDIRTNDVREFIDAHKDNKPLWNDNSSVTGLY